MMITFRNTSLSNRQNHSINTSNLTHRKVFQAEDKQKMRASSPILEANQHPRLYTDNSSAPSSNSNLKCKLFRKTTDRHPMMKFFKQIKKGKLLQSKQIEPSQKAFKRYHEVQRCDSRQIEQNVDNRLCVILKWSKGGSNIKERSFEQFLQAKKKKQALKKREYLRGNEAKHSSFLEKQGLNLLGRSMKDQQVKQVSNIRRGVDSHCATQPSSRNKQRNSKLYTLQPQEESAKQSYIKYVFKEEEGYCLFNKYLDKQTAKSSQKNCSKRLSSIERSHKMSKVLERSNKSKLDSGKIQGWIVNISQQGYVQ